MPYKDIKYILKVIFEIKFHYAAQAGHIYDLASASQEGGLQAYTKSS